eukprot:TRINITY_DN51002_c0_g1_i1.p1 TRINITY_DN51002_c0_g1~~TRINITY_DN51002_c0_g1_i1.p1  ORF type:complete len:484 (+),score=121.24 TRINITY_DN51002_c0_g1_i1:74-1525(+)
MVFGMPWLFCSAEGSERADSTPAAEDDPDAVLPMRELMERLIGEHRRKVDAARKGASYEDGNDAFRSLVETLVNTHEQKVADARLKFSMEKQADIEAEKWNTVCGDSSDGGSGDYLWSVADTKLFATSASKKAECERQADSLRAKCDALESDVKRIKESISKAEAGMLGALDVLRKSEWGPMEADYRRKVAKSMRQIEADDEWLARTRFEQLLMLENVRVTKVERWRLDWADRVNDEVTAASDAMRAGAKAWWDGAERVALETLEQELFKQKHQLDSIAQKTYLRLEETIKQTHEIECHLRDHGEAPAWDLGGEQQDLYFDLLAHTCELKVLAWKRNHLRDRQFHLLQLRWKALRTHVMLFRQHTLQQVLAKADPASLCDMYVKVERLGFSLQKKAESTKRVISVTLADAMETQTKLRSKKTIVSEETDDLRDHNLVLLYKLLTEDLRLVWLRKEQLQTIELAGLIRAKASMEEVKLPEVGDL